MNRRDIEDSERLFTEADEEELDELYDQVSRRYDFHGHYRAQEIASDARRERFAEILEMRRAQVM